MGWRFKLILLLIVYFAGVATAIYYLAPADTRQCQAAGYLNNSSNDGSQSIDSTAVKDYCSKAYAKASASFSDIDWENLKEKFNIAVQKLAEKAKNSRNTVAEGSEDK